MNRFKSIITLAPLSILAACASASRQAPPTATQPAATTRYTAKTSGMDRRDGFIPIYLDAKQGKILLDIPSDSMRALMFVGLATGLGSNPIGLDRGAGGDS
ncbi:MAG: hypothetical protein H0U13_13475, partial [Gemmatimonadaceae bacterium]|nr:hypothetical protein [Gemmatimonadaceae bacterium]